MDREEPLPPCTTTEAHPGSPAQDPALENSRLHFPRPYVLQPADPQSRASTPGPRPRLIKQPKSVIPTTRTTSWRAGSRDHARPENPVLAGAGAIRRPAPSAGPSAGLNAGPVPRGTGVQKRSHSAPMSAPRARTRRSAAGWSSRIWNPRRCGFAVASQPIARVIASSRRVATAH